MQNNKLEYEALSANGQSADCSVDPRLLQSLRRAANKTLQLGPSMTKKDLDRFSDSSVVTRYAGKPSGLRELDHKGQVVFRHYVMRAEVLDVIKKQGSTGILKAGPTPYATGARNLDVVRMRAISYWEDITGIFLTTPDFSPEAVGTATSEAYIDLVLDSKIPVLQVSPGIFVFSSKPGTEIPVKVVGEGKLS